MRKKAIIHNKNFLLSISILLIGVFISSAVLAVGGGFQDLGRKIDSLLPKFPYYGSIKEISDYSKIENVLSSQPSLSYNSKAKFVIVESSDFDCPNCARFHGYQSPVKSSFEKMFEDFVRPGVMDYIFIDLQFLKGPEKHIAAYCAGEQNPKSFFEYKELMYKNFDENFDEARATTYAALVRLDTNKFVECFRSQKYLDRIKNLSNFNSNQLQATSTPTFTIFKIEEKEVINPDNTKQIQKFYTQLGRIVGNANYETTMKPQIEEMIGR
ncbi:MAG: hypothetical protein KatS3mg084_0605 [Candidatus Dojkabacteria bacterium]|nr:MAG: hypothetical protein KatS3mg084_0605 [Candidatus Dojkabacteria bacterium]